jgi:quercetin dioxygenase-like cupin family protein
MKRPLALTLAAVAAALSIGVAVATPGTGVVGSILARATFDPISTSQSAGLDVAVQEITIAPGGHTGWHTHPGGTVILVESGTFTIYNDACAATDVAAGRGIVEPGGQVQLARNNSTTEPLVLTVAYFDLAVGGSPRSDAAAPACAAGAGLPTVPTGSGVTAAIVSRANFAAAASITGTDERDVVVQQVTIAPGGHSGWHSHPGATVINVDAGTFTFYSATDCVAQNFAAGQGVVEAGGGVQLARNEGTEPLVLHVVYFDVPVGGDFRIDEPEPANCTGLAPVPTATPVPTAVPTAAPTASALPDVAVRAEPGPISPSPLPTLLPVACLAGLLALGLFRTRRRS